MWTSPLLWASGLRGSFGAAGFQGGLGAFIMWNDDCWLMVGGWWLVVGG